MKMILIPTRQMQHLPILLAVMFGMARAGSSQDIVVNPARGGGLDTNAPMVHVDVFYDADANQMRAALDGTKGMAILRPLPPGYTVDVNSKYSVVAGKAYNLQYAWNPGGVFTPPAGASVWIECLSSSPGLEVYDGPGNKMENPPRRYSPIFGTAGSSKRWEWYGRMAHNTYAIRNPTSPIVTAEYRIYFGDAETGDPEAYADYGDAIVRLSWAVNDAATPQFQFGALDQSGGSGPLAFLNGGQYLTSGQTVVNLRSTEAEPGAAQFASPISALVVPATLPKGGPAANHAALGSCLALEFVSLTGPAQGQLSFWDRGEAKPCVTVAVGENDCAERLRLSAGDTGQGEDPYGCIEGRRAAANKPGLYCLGFRVVDTSSNNGQGGSIHTASEVYRVYFQAGLTINSLTRQGTTAMAAFGGETGKSFYLERCAALDTETWETVAGPLAGAGRIQTLTDPAAVGGNEFYRVRATAP